MLRGESLLKLFEESIHSVSAAQGFSPLSTEHLGVDSPE